MELRADKKSLKGLLSIDEQQFRIPPYQRPYSRTTEQVDDLWDDLVSNIATGHFLGSIVMSTEDESRPQVIDGQQRLTTLMLLLAALRDECAARGMDQQVKRIDRRLVADDLAEGDAYFKFKTSAANWPVFRDFVLRAPADPLRMQLSDVTALDPTIRARNRPLLDNLARIKSLLASKLDTAPDAEREGWLTCFDKQLMERVELVVIEVKNLADAFLLFETLNDRGLQLSAADLLKSHLLGEIAKTAGQEDVDAAAAHWDSMLESLGAHVDVTRFLRHYLLGTRPTVKKDEVFGHFKDLVKTQGADKVLVDLRRSAAFYGDFEAPERVSSPASRRVLTDLQTLRATTCYIALLPARHYLSELDFIEFARLAEVLTFRYSSVVGLGTNDIERKYHDAAKILIESQGAKLDLARSVLIAAAPDREQFMVAFERLTMGRQYLLRYTLQKLEESLVNNKEKTFKSSALVHIEHIMPQKLSPRWKQDLGDEIDKHTEYVNKWGNLTLLFAGLNIPASNKPFSEKQKHYADSEVLLTTNLMDKPVWGPVQIDERQRWLADHAERLWRIDAAVMENASPGVSTLARFEALVGDLWPTVGPLCVETSAEEASQLAERIPAHLHEGGQQGNEAQGISAELRTLLDSWASYDLEQRGVVRAAVAYFLKVDDAIADTDVGGLDDDRTVLNAARQVLTPAP